MCERLKMEAPTSSSHLQNILRRVVQTVQWTYTIYWKLCSTQRILAWSDGYYNGAIKTRKTVQLKEVSAEEASLHRSQQLRELYETLCAGEANQQTKRPSAALSPEDLTETEWFYMMCFSYYFPLAVGLPGRAYAKRQHVWLTGANGVDSQVFSRAILAKQSAQIQTVICIPLLDGVVELGTTEKVYEDLGLIQQIINFFIQSHESQQQLPKQALSEHSTSDPPTFSGFRSSDVIASPAEYITVLSSQVAADTNNQTEKEEEEEEDGSSDDLSDTSIFNDIISSPLIQNPNSIRQTQTQISDHMQIDDMDSDYHILRPPAARQIGNQETIRTDENEYLGFQPSPPGTSSFHELAQEEDAHYSKTVALILPAAQSSRCSGISTATNFINPSSHSSAFFNCSSAGYSVSNHLFSGSSQRQLKYILFTVPFLHSKDTGGTSQIDSYPRKAGTPQEVLIGGANHVLVERRRREKLNERFIMLRL